MEKDARVHCGPNQIRFRSKVRPVFGNIWKTTTKRGWDGGIAQDSRGANLLPDCLRYDIQLHSLSDLLEIAADVTDIVFDGVL